MNLQDKSDIKALFAIKTLMHSVGGAERMIASLTGALASRGMNVDLLTFDAPEAPSFFPVDPVVNRHFVSTENTSRKTGIMEYPKLLWRLRRQVTALKPDVVIAFMHSMFVPMQLALFGTGIKVVLSEHTTPAYYATRKLEFLALRFFSLFAHSITIVSDGIRALYPPEMRRKMVVLPDTVISDFTAADRSGNTILSVGRLNSDKDHRILIEAFAMIAPEYPDWILKIYGEGPERAALENLISVHGLGQRVFLPGISSDMDVVYRSSQIFVMPSRYESFGLVTAEAMTHALPVIGFADCAGTNELIENEVNGILIKVRNASNLSLALKALIEDLYLRQVYGNSGQDKTRQFSLDNVANKWKAYISQAVSHKARVGNFRS